MNSLFSVAHKTVLVTGGTRGIGRMIALGFKEAGAARVIITSRSPPSEPDPRLEYLAANLSSRQGCLELVQCMRDDLGIARLDVLIHNAGTSWGEPPERDSRTNWGFDKVLDLNVKSIYYLTRDLIPLLQGGTPEDPTRIITIGSVAGFLPQEAPTHAYDVSKAAVHHLTRKLAADLAPQHITVNCVAPGFVPTRMSAGLATWGADAKSLAQRVPLGRLGNADDMAGACIYLASRAGSWCTGVILNVDGGTVGATQIPLSSL